MWNAQTHEQKYFQQPLKPMIKCKFTGAKTPLTHEIQLYVPILDSCFVQLKHSELYADPQFYVNFPNVNSPDTCVLQ